MPTVSPWLLANHCSVASSRFCTMSDASGWLVAATATGTGDLGFTAGWGSTAGGFTAGGEAVSAAAIGSGIGAEATSGALLTGAGLRQAETPMPMPMPKTNKPSAASPRPHNLRGAISTNSASIAAANTWRGVISCVCSENAASKALSAMILMRRVKPRETREISRTAPILNTSGPLYPAWRMRKFKYARMSVVFSGSRRKLCVMRSFNWRIFGSASVSSNSGCPNKTICSSFWLCVSRFDNKRISSSVAIGMACASSTNSTTWRPAACCCTR